MVQTVEQVSLAVSLVFQMCIKKPFSILQYLKHVKSDTEVKEG